MSVSINSIYSISEILQGYVIICRLFETEKLCNMCNIHGSHKYAAACSICLSAILSLYYQLQNTTYKVAQYLIKIPYTSLKVIPVQSINNPYLHSDFQETYTVLRDYKRLCLSRHTVQFPHSAFNPALIQLCGLYAEKYSLILSFTSPIYFLYP